QGLESAKLVEKPPADLFIQDTRDELANRIVVGRVWIDPTAVNLGLVNRFDHVLLDAGDEVGRNGGRTQGPRPYQGLVKQVLVIPVRGVRSFERDAMPFVPALPARQTLLPLAGQFREDIQAGANILAALGVVGRGGGQGVRPEALTVLVEFVQCRGRDAEAAGVAAN